MKINYEELKGIRIIENYAAQDIRGSFTKVYNKENFENQDLVSSYFETYYSISQKDVIRGMHFQAPPFDHEKLVHVIQGSITDVILDLRLSSLTYGKFMEISIDDKDNCSIYIPKGFAHGFRSLEDNTIVIYNVSTNYNKECDCGIRWDGFGYNWNVTNPIISDRDQSFVTLDEYDSVFK
jgi:dTDP-4-dehydrorhamnose 3,5-epimerase